MQKQVREDVFVDVNVAEAIRIYIWISIHFDNIETVKLTYIIPQKSFGCLSKWQFGDNYDLLRT